MRSDAFDSTDRRPRDDGFTIAEVLVSILLIMVVATGVAGLFGLAIKATHAARDQTSTSTLAEEKMEQLRSLTWGFDGTDQNLPVTDTTTNLSYTPATDAGGGLNPSPADALRTNTPGYVDYLDRNGQWVGTGSTPPSSTVYVRRWSIQPLPTNPNNTIILQVLVTTANREANLQNGPGPRQRHPGDALLATVKTRKAF